MSRLEGNGREGGGSARKKRLMLVLQNLGAGGAERVMATLADHFDKSAFEVDLVVLAELGEAVTQVCDPAVNVIHLRRRRARWAFASMFRLIRDRKPDAVLSTLGHVNVLTALLKPVFPATRFFGREANIPSIEVPRQGNPRLLAFLYRRLYPRLDGIVCQSQDMREDLRANFGVPEGRLHLIHNPVDTGRIRKLAMEGGPPFPAGRSNILFVGRLEPQKRPWLLVPLMERFAPEEDFHMHILGAGSLKDRLEADFASSSARSRVTFWGVQRNPYRFMRHADALVLTSSHEGFPNVILEASACGLKSVAFRRPGVTGEIIQEGVNGHLVEGDDLDAMADRIRRSARERVDEEALRARIGERFGVETIIRMYEQMMDPA